MAIYGLMIEALLPEKLGVETEPDGVKEFPLKEPEPL